MKKLLCAVGLTVAIALNYGSAYAQSGRTRLIREVVVPVLTQAAPELLQLFLRTLENASSDAQKSAFSDGEWLVAIQKNGNDFTYYGVNLKTRDSIALSGARIVANRQRQVYTWNNGAYRYQVAWQPANPGAIRLQVFDGRGKELLDRLLYKANL